MRYLLECITCSLNSFIKLLDEFEAIPLHEKEDMVREHLAFLSSIDYNRIPPDVGRDYQETISRLLKMDDPYYEQKRLQNKQMLERYDDFYQSIQMSQDPIKAAFILSIGGNILDPSPMNKLNAEDVILSALKTPLTIDDYDLMLDKLKKAKRILFLADNAGEFVLDKLLIQVLLEQEVVKRESITVVVRGKAIFNDVLMEDAVEIGMDKLVHVMDNGDNVPGTIYETTSSSFKQAFNSADIILAKGQGSFETLYEAPNEKVFNLFIAKCDPVARLLGVDVGGFICRQNIQL